MREEKRGSTVRKRKAEHLGEESGTEEALITGAGLNITETSKLPMLLNICIYIKQEQMNGSYECKCS